MKKDTWMWCLSNGLGGWYVELHKITLLSEVQDWALGQARRYGPTHRLASRAIAKRYRAPVMKLPITKEQAEELGVWDL